MKNLRRIGKQTRSKNRTPRVDFLPFPKAAAKKKERTNLVVMNTLLKPTREKQKHIFLSTWTCFSFFLCIYNQQGKQKHTFLSTWKNIYIYIIFPPHHKHQPRYESGVVNMTPNQHVRNLPSGSPRPGYRTPERSTAPRPLPSAPHTLELGFGFLVSGPTGVEKAVQ